MTPLAVFHLFADPAIYLQLCLTLCCVGGLISTFEFLVVLPTFRPSGIYSWRVIETEQVRRLGATALAPYLRSFGSITWAGSLLVTRAVALAALPFVPLQTALFLLVSFTLCLSTMLFTWRRFIGDDGSDQMTTIILVTVMLSAGFGSGLVALAIGLWFLAFQACLSYVSAGLAKAFSPEWRDGSAIFKVFNTEAYGLRPVAALVRAHPIVGGVAAWSVIVFECLFPLVVIAPPPVMMGLLSMGLLFHVLCAVIMGLNSFLWAFTATYPAVVFANLSLRAAFGLT